MPGSEGRTYSGVVCWAGSSRAGCWTDGAMNCAEWFESTGQTAGLPTTTQYTVWEACSHDSRFLVCRVIDIKPYDADELILHWSLLMVRTSQALD